MILLTHPDEFKDRLNKPNEIDIYSLGPMLCYHAYNLKTLVMSIMREWSVLCLVVYMNEIQITSYIWRIKN